MERREWSDKATKSTSQCERDVCDMIKRHAGGEFGAFNVPRLIPLVNAIAAARIAELEAELATLPKIGQLVGEGDERRIVWDVVATLGMTAYRVDGTRYQVPSIHKGEIWAIRQNANGRHEINASPKRWYATQAAAQFAIEQKALTPNPAVRGGG